MNNSVAAIDRFANRREKVDPVIQRVWFELLQRSWQSVAVIPTDTSVPVDGIAEKLAAAGQQQGVAIRLLDGRDAQLGDYAALVQKMNSGPAAVIQVAPIADDPVALAIGKAASVVVVVARTGTSTFKATRDLVEAVGRDRIAGAVLVP